MKKNIPFYIAAIVVLGLALSIIDFYDEGAYEWLDNFTQSTFILLFVVTVNRLMARE
ncbi:hypothetical protein [Oceanobacillus kapialis]|uniref:Uncharacterized protein n=1 Tax=Oceanobacillus kapialis TaxID=481353 RepID=A0ABW5Q0C0_9BACI